MSGGCLGEGDSFNTGGGAMLVGQTGNLGLLEVKLETAVMRVGWLRWWRDGQSRARRQWTGSGGRGCGEPRGRLDSLWLVPGVGLLRDVVDLVETIVVEDVMTTTWDLVEIEGERRVEAVGWYITDGVSEW